MDPGESDCLIKTKQRESLIIGEPSLWFLPSAMNVKVMKFNQALVNGGSNYDSLEYFERRKFHYCGFLYHCNTFEYPILGAYMIKFRG